MSHLTSFLLGAVLTFSASAIWSHYAIPRAQHEAAAMERHIVIECLYRGQQPMWNGECR